MQAAGQARVVLARSGAASQAAGPASKVHGRWLDANEYLVMEAVARDRVDDLRATIALALATADEPICEVCKGPMEPIPPVGWFCLGGHEEPVAQHAAHR